MENLAQPSDLEISQERLIALKNEHKHLSYEIKKKEMSHSSYYSKIQQQIRQQWTKIADLKKQKNELTLELRLLESESFTSKGNKNMKIFLKLLEELIKLENGVKNQTELLKKYNIEIGEIDKKMRLKQKEVIKANRNKDRVLKHQKDISFLENRLCSSLNKYNQLLVNNNALREDINSLLQTQTVFRKQCSSMRHLLSSRKKNLSEVVHSATTSYQTGESIKYKLNVLKERTHIDQKKLEEKIKELQLLMEQDKLFKEYVEFKKKERDTSREAKEFESKKEQVIEQKLQDNHALMSRIYCAASCKDVDKICKTYIQQEETNVKLFEKVNDLNVEIEKLYEEVRVEREQFEIMDHQYKEQNRKNLAEKNEVDAVTDKLRKEAQELEESADSKAAELEQVKRVIERIFKYLDSISGYQVLLTVEEAISDDNILLYLEALEKRITDLIEYQKALDKQIYYMYEE